MENSNKFIWLLIALAALSTIALGSEPLYYYLVETAGSTVPKTTQAAWKMWQVAVGSVSNVACALWLWYEARRANLSVAMWALFGLVFGLFAVLIFYMKAIYEQLHNKANQEGTP
ncbi:MAG: hypothetical protein P1U64_13150 [Alcanivoracaceae bacterium]|nr:hypothetical protein [Alcanivoracaceae bacterium]